MPPKIMLGLLSTRDARLREFGWVQFPKSTPNSKSSAVGAPIGAKLSRSSSVLQRRNSGDAEGCARTLFQIHGTGMRTGLASAQMATTTPPSFENAMQEMAWDVVAQHLSVPSGNCQKLT